jgi:hypothetical protein
MTDGTSGRWWFEEQGLSERAEGAGYDGRMGWQTINDMWRRREMCTGVTRMEHSGAEASLGPWR